MSENNQAAASNDAAVSPHVEFFAVVNGAPRALTLADLAQALLSDEQAGTALMNAMHERLFSPSVTTTETAPSDLQPDTHLTGNELYPVSIANNGQSFNDRVKGTDLANWIIPQAVQQAHHQLAQAAKDWSQQHMAQIAAAFAEQMANVFAEQLTQAAQQTSK